MTFPVHLEVFGTSWHPHFIFEVIALVAAVILYFILRHRAGRPPFAPETILKLICGCLFGAWIGSKLLLVIGSPRQFLTLEGLIRGLAQGKTTVGALLGAWVGIEIVKRRLQLRTSTGEFFVYPLALGIAIGRIGCFLSGLPDHTHGVASALPWAVDFGDGVRRHPTQIYEAIYVLLLAVAVDRLGGIRPGGPAKPFQRFLAGYFLFRLAVDFLKPRATILWELDANQIASALALVALGWAESRASPRESLAECRRRLPGDQHQICPPRHGKESHQKSIINAASIK